MASIILKKLKKIYFRKGYFFKLNSPTFGSWKEIIDFTEIKKVGVDLKKILQRL